MSNKIPRRARTENMTPEELAMLGLSWQIEELGAHPLLTDVVVLLGSAREKLGDWVDLQSAQQRLQSDKSGAGGTLENQP